MTSRTDTERLVQFLRDHPGSSVMEVRMSLWISNVTGRMSDARAQGITFAKWRDDHGVYRYSIVVPRTVTTGDTVAMGLA